MCFMSEHRGEEGLAVGSVDGEDVKSEGELCGRGAVVDSDFRASVGVSDRKEEDESWFHEGMIARNAVNQL